MEQNKIYYYLQVWEEELDPDCEDSCYIQVLSSNDPDVTDVSGCYLVAENETKTHSVQELINWCNENHNKSRIIADVNGNGDNENLLLFPYPHEV